MKRFRAYTALLLVFVMLWGMFPAGALAAGDCNHENVTERLVANGNKTHTTIKECVDCGEKIVPEVSSETAIVRVDFKEFAKKAAQQPWWNELRAAVGTNTKFVGNTDSTNTMGPYMDAYDAMQAYLEENECWKIDESISNLSKGFKRLYFNSDSNVPWGLSYYTYYQGGAQAARSRLAFTVEAEKSGWYDLSMDLFKEWSDYNERRNQTGDYPGGGFIDIRINDELVCERLSFADRSNSRMVEKIGKVWLNEGENSVVFTALRAYNGEGEVVGGRFNVSINAMVFVMAPHPVMLPGTSTTIDPTAYVAFGNSNITAQTHSVTSTDETVAAVRFDEHDRLIIDAGKNGIAELIVTTGTLETCRIKVTVGDGETVPCTDEEENGICDVCEAVCGVCRHKKTTVEVVDNGDETKTTTETCDYCGEVVRRFTRSDREIVLDFKDFAKDISKYDWWDDLIAAADEETKMIGSSSPDAAMSDKAVAAYEKMREHLAQNYQWNIDEETSQFANKAYWKRLFINHSDDVPWGLCYFPIYHSQRPERAKLAFTVEVPEGKAGMYHLDLSVFLEDTNSGTEAQTGTYAGGGYVDIYVNGELIYDEYSFKGASISKTDSLGAVYLHEGENSLVLESTSSYSYDNYAGRCNLDLQSVRFTLLDEVKVSEYLTESLDLRKTYLTYDFDLSDCTVASDNDLIALADLSSAGMLTITGVNRGNTTVRVYRGGVQICEIPVCVGAFEGTLDELNGNAVKANFVSVLNKAAQLPLWNDLTDGEDGRKAITVEDEDLHAWIAENALWSIASVDGTLESAVGSGLVADGRVEAALNVPAAGQYNLNVEASGNLTVSVNSDAVYEDLVAQGAVSLGAVYLEKGSNILCFEGDAQIRSVTLTPLGIWQTEVGAKRYVNLNTSYLPFDVKVNAAAFAATSKDSNVVQVSMDTDGELILTGVSEGESIVTVSGPDGFSTALSVKVVAKSACKEVNYTVDGVRSLTLKPGDVAEGEITGRTENGTPISDKQLRSEAGIYFATTDRTVASVDQTTGNVTAYGEGTAVITFYAMVDGVTHKSEVTVCVTDETDLADITLLSPVDFVAVGSGMRLSVSGIKASGAAADMANFPVSYTVSDDTLASVTADGYLTALKPGTVEVTATACVRGVAVSHTKQIELVESTRMAHENVLYDFTLGLVLNLKTATVEKDGVEIDWANSYLEGTALTYAAKSGLASGVSMPVGEQLAFNVLIPVDGWYTAEVWSSLESYGGVADVFVDDIYAGVADFNQGGNSVYDGHSCMNTIYLTAGVHSYRLVSTKVGQWFIGKILFSAVPDPRPMEVSLETADTMLVGQSVTVEQKIETANHYGDFTLKQTEKTPNYTNYCIITSSDPAVVSVSGNTLKAKKPGTAVIEMKAEINGEEVLCSKQIKVESGTVAAVEAVAEKATMRPTDGGTAITVTALDMEGNAMELPEGCTVSYRSLNEAVATVSEDGAVSITGQQGSAEIEVTVMEDGRDVTASLWITVTEGKTAPTLYTYEERDNARENVLKYDWAWRQKEAAVRLADFAVEHLDEFYDMLIYSDLPHIYHVGTRTDPEMYYCRYCKTDLSKNYTVYPWIVDPISNPWKITCPECKRDFPSNDFGAYFESGLQENGRFDAEKADKSLLVNELYPEMGPGWGVDDGFGYITGNVYPNGAKENHYYIAYYVHCVFYTLGNGSINGMTKILPALTNAYLYTGDEKYGNAGAILIDRMADVYGEYDYTDWIGDWDKGLITHAVWEANTFQPILAKAADAFWPCMTNDEVVEYLRARSAWKGLEPEQITPDQIRQNVEDGILLVVKKTCENGQSYGNFGMHQSAMAYAAVALDRMPETAEMIEWVFRDGGLEKINGEEVITGGDLMDSLVNRIDRDGFGDEGSDAYNRLWYQNLMEVADALAGYDRVEGADLWKNPKFVSMFGCYTDLIIMGRGSMISGEDGAIQDMGLLTQPEYLVQVFQATGNRDVARNLYFINGNRVDGLHGDIFMKNPESGIRAAIQRIVDEDGPLDTNASNMLCGHGMAILRNGPKMLVRGRNESEFSDYWMYFGINGNTHGTRESLTLMVDAFGLPMTSNMGYPTVVNEQNPQRMQWIKNTISHNTVVVDDEIQSSFKPNAFPLHFDDSGKVKIMDIESPNAYPKTDIYRRTVVSVQAMDNVYYAIDFFRILGGSEHLYSFHAVTMQNPKTSGLELVHQPMGTYAGPEVPYGDHTTNPYSNDAALNTGTGYSWLDDVYRDDTPDTTFSVDWQIQDFRGILTDSSGIHLKLTMLSDEPLTEVAIANGHPPTRAENPDHVEFLLARRSGETGMDSLFTTVIEPYRYNSYIYGTEIVPAQLVEGEEEVTDRAAAVKVLLENGREDYIVYATNPDCTYRVDDRFDFAGAIGVCTYLDGVLTYAYGNEATLVANLIEDALPEVTGTVLDFTEGLAEEYFMTIETDQSVTEDMLVGSFIYVDNDHSQNGVYRIYDAEIKGNTAVLDLHTQTLTRSYLDSKNMDAGFIHNIAVGQTFTIPLASSADVAEFFNYTTDTVVRAGNKLNLSLGTGTATYEAEGLVTGMKLDAKTGTLTWTTSKTNVGKYPITIKAVCDGEVIGTMRFTVYVVNYTGSTYAPDKCSHAKAVDFGTEIVCPACGTITKVEQEEVQKFNIAGTNMTLGNELKLNVLVNSADLGNGTYTAKITHNGEETEQALAKYNSGYHYVTVTVAAKQMADTITVEIFDENGNAASNIYETSVRSYAMRLLSMNQTDEIKALLVDMLNYGAEAQTYFKYNEADLANSLLTDEQKALATERVNYTNKQIRGKNFYGANLSLEDRIVLNLFFKNCKEEMYAKVIYTDYTGKTITVQKSLEPYSGSIYKVIIDDIVLADAFSAVNVTVYNADGTIHGTAADSVESYIARTGDNALNEAIMKFAYAAKQYLA